MRLWLDPYVKSYLLPDRHRDSKRKTESRNNTLHPTYNSRFEYLDVDVDRQMLEVRPARPAHRKII